MAFRNRRFQAGRRRRFTPRRSTFRRRSFRNGRSRTTRRYSRPRTNVRRVRNLASRKCRDNMICTPIDDTGTPQTPGPVSMDASSVYGFIFSPTARTAGTQLESGERVNAPSSAQRRKSKCYVRGYGETVEIQTDDASPWVWRRIVFSTIGLASQFDPGLCTTMTKLVAGVAACSISGVVRSRHPLLRALSLGTCSKVPKVSIGPMS